MSEFLQSIRRLAEAGNVRVSVHGFDRVQAHGLSFFELLDSMPTAELIEAYPDYHAGPTVLLLHHIADGPVHAVWGLEKGTDEPLVLVTAYRPDPARWSDDFTQRRR